MPATTQINTDELSISEMLVKYNELAAELNQLGGSARERRSFSDRAEATKFVTAMESRVKAFKDGLAQEAKREATQGDAKVTATQTETTTTKTKAAKADPKPRARSGKDPKSSLTPMRPDTIRAKMLELMDGKHTPVDIAKKVGIEDHKITAHLGALHKHTGVGYAFDEAGKVSAVYPKGKSYADAVKAAE